jgi:hypothetical protein
MEQEMQTDGDVNRILVLVSAGEDEARKVADAKRAAGLSANDSARLLVIRFCHPDRPGRVYRNSLMSNTISATQTMISPYIHALPFRRSTNVTHAS